MDPVLLLDAQLEVEISAPVSKGTTTIPFLNKKDLATVTHALVTSRLDYCKVLCTLEQYLETADGLKCSCQTLSNVSCFEHIISVLFQKVLGPS